MANTFINLQQSAQKVLQTATHILHRKKRASFILRLIVNLAFAFLNIAILTISVVALVKVLEIYSTHRHYDFVSKILPMILVSSLSLLIFILSIILAIYNNINKIDSYKAAYEKVLYYYAHYQANAKSCSEAELTKVIKQVVTELKNERKKSQFTKILSQSLTKGE